jgi:hypothetical protein
MSVAALQHEFPGFPCEDARTVTEESSLERFVRLSSEKGGLFPQTMVAEFLGLTQQRAGQMISQGLLRVEVVGKRPYVTGESLEELLYMERGSGKAPRKLSMVDAARLSLRELGRMRKGRK